MAEKAELTADTERLQKQVASLKRKVAKLEAEKDWAYRERDITQKWAEKAWHEVDWLRGLCEKYYAAGARIDSTLNDGCTHPLGRLVREQDGSLRCVDCGTQIDGEVAPT